MNPNYIYYDNVKISSEFTPFVKKIEELFNKIDELFFMQISEEEGVYQGNVKKFFKKNPDYETDPYSVLIINKETATEIPYSEYYKDKIDGILHTIQGINVTIEKIKLRSFNTSWWLNYFKVISESFKTNNWSEIEQTFLQLAPESSFSLSIGPIERYHDFTRGIKRYFSGWFLMKTPKEDEYSDWWKGLINIAHTDTHLFPYKYLGNNRQDITLFMGDLLLEAGEVAKLQAQGWSRPENVHHANKYGTIKSIALNKYYSNFSMVQGSIEEMLTKWKVDTNIANRIKKYIQEYLIFDVITHEFAHTFNKPLGANEYLGNYYTIIEEPRAEINKLYLLHHFEKQEKIPSKTTLCSMFTSILRFNEQYSSYKENGQGQEYLFSIVFWIFKSLEYGFINIENGKIVFQEKIEDRTFSNYINELTTYFNTIAFYSNGQSGHIKVHKKFLEEKTEEYAELLLN